MNKVQQLENNISVKELKTSYDTISELVSDVKNISTKYNLKYSIYNEDEEIISSLSLDKKDILILSSVRLVGNKLYTISFYGNKNREVFSIIFQLVIFQIIVVALVMVIFFLVTKVKVVSPVEQIIQNIRNYQGGKKLIKTPLHHEFGLIQNEFFKLVDYIKKDELDQTRIIASISHDIKTPLTSIIGYANLINDGSLTKEEMKQYNKKILDKSLNIKNILNDFDDYLSTKTNHTLNLSNMTIAELVLELNNDYKLDLEGKGIQFIVNTKLTKDVITLDLSKIKRIFANIISNSMRYLTKGGVITINILKKDTCYLFQVKDNGPGVDEEILDYIFDFLFTTDNSRKISGLGLSIVKEFVLLHKGQIKAYNDKGLTIEFTIPFDLKDDS